VEEALIREFQEEFSVPVRPLSFIGEAAFTHGETEFTLRGYGVELLSGDFTLLVHSAWRWAALEEIETLDFADSDRLLFPAVRAYLARL
jgi:8-oxo-dGTP diphosphatase